MLKTRIIYEKLKHNFKTKIEHTNIKPKLNTQTQNED